MRCAILVIFFELTLAACKPAATSSLAVDSYLPEVRDMISLCNDNITNGVGRVSTSYFSAYAVTTYKKNVCQSSSRSKSLSLESHKPQYPVIVAMQYGDVQNDKLISKSHKYIKDSLQKQKDLLVVDVSNMSPQTAERKVAAFRKQNPEAFKNDVRILAGGHGSYTYDWQHHQEPIGEVVAIGGTSSNEPYGQFDEAHPYTPEESQSTGNSSDSVYQQPPYLEDDQTNPSQGFNNTASGVSDYEEQYRHFISASDKDGSTRIVRTKSLVAAIMKGSGADAEFICTVHSCYSGAAVSDIMRDKSLSEKTKAVLASSQAEQVTWAASTKDDEESVISTLVDQKRLIEDPKFKTMLDHNEDGSISMEEYLKYRSGSNTISAGRATPIVEKSEYDTSFSSSTSSYNSTGNNASPQPADNPQEIVARRTVPVPFTQYQVNIPKVMMTKMVPNPLGILPGVPKSVPGIRIHRDVKTYTADLTAKTREGLSASDVALWPSLPDAYQKEYDGKFQPLTREVIRNGVREYNEKDGLSKYTIKENSDSRYAQPLPSDYAPEDGQVVVPPPSNQGGE